MGSNLTARFIAALTAPNKAASWELATAPRVQCGLVYIIEPLDSSELLAKPVVRSAQDRCPQAELMEEGINDNMLCRCRRLHEPVRRSTCGQI